VQKLKPTPGKPSVPRQAVARKWCRENPMSLALLVQRGITAGKNQHSLRTQEQRLSCVLSEDRYTCCDLDLWPFDSKNGFPGFIVEHLLSSSVILAASVFSERELALTFAICHRRSVCLSVICLSVTFVHPTQPVEIFGTVSSPFGTLAIHWRPRKISRRSSQGNPSVWGFKRKRGSQI